MSMPPPPPGFELVEGAAGVPPPPPGFVMEGVGAGRFAQPALAGAAQPVDAMADAGGQLVRGINRSINTALSLPGEIVGGAVNFVAPGQGDRFRWNNPVSQFMASPEAPPQTDLGRYAESVGQALGASVLPVAGIAAKAQQAAGPAAQTVLGGIGQQIVNAYRTAPGTAIAADVAASAGAGIGQQVAEDLGFGTTGQMVGSLAGAMTPAGVASAVGALGRNPAVASARQAVDNWRADRARPDVAPDQMFSAGPQMPQRPPGPRMPRITTAEAAADQAIANQLARANLDVPEIQNRLAQYVDALPAGQPPAMVLADADNSLARLASTSARKNPEAANIADAVIYGRQTGETPRGGMPANSGVATRPAFTPEVPGQPMGQNERVRDALRSALEIPPGSAYAYGKGLQQKMRDEARVAYGQLYKDAAGLDVRPAIQPVLNAWAARAKDEPRDVAKAINAAIRTYAARSGTVGTLERFQKAKEFLDGRISNYMESIGDGRDRYLGGLLSQMQRDLRGAIDGIQINNIGPRYAAARQQFATDAQQKKAIDLGRKAFRADSEVTADIYGGLNPAEQRLFRLGLFESYERNIGGAKKTNDITQTFESPRVQQLLQVVMKDDAAAQFGRMLQSGEKQFIRTRNEQQGNSKTAQRQQDDEATEAVMGVVDKLRLLRRPAEATIEAISSVISRTFGFRADTHAQIARQLYTADRATQERILERVAKRLGPNRYSQFQMMMNEAYGRAAQAGAATVAPAVSQTNQQPRQP
jgi:hypothetical protein